LGFAHSPNEQHLPWAVADWAGSRYDSILIGVNTHKGFMGCYLPKVVVMRKEQFEALGNRISVEDIPVWLDKTNSAGISEAVNQPTTASSAWGNEYQFQAQRAFDGDLKTRWSSRFGEKNSWLSVDLGKRMRISGVKLFWENAAAKA
jgi:F5/8 type C domain